jgi:hypothetical protein
MFHGQNPSTIFHGENSLFPSDQAWRVDGTDHAMHGRDRFDCPEGEADGEMWYIGSPRDSSHLTGGDLRFFNVLQTWAQNLHTQGYTGREGQGLIFQAARSLPSGDIDPSTPPEFVWPNRRGGSTTAGGQDPYTLNWLLRPDGSGGAAYNFGPPPPPEV